MNSEPELDVIAVGAHPDDCEIGCGGTLASLAKSGLKVGIIDLTDGEPTPNCDDPAIRVKEAHAAADKLGVTKRINRIGNRRQDANGFARSLASNADNRCSNLLQPAVQMGRAF